MLGGLTAKDLSSIVRKRIGTSPMPRLQDESARLRALEIARAQGLIDRIRRDLAVTQAIPVLPYSKFRDYRRTGTRRNYEKLLAWRVSQIDLAAMGCYLGLDAREYLQDLLWAHCETSWWIYPAHEGHGVPIDLRVAMTGCEFATIITLLEDKIEAEVRDRVRAEIDRRVFRPFLNPRRREYQWEKTTNNWNAVCNGAIGVAAMLLERDPRRLAAILTRILEHLPAFLDGFTPDGGCTEGPSYWRFGFGWYVRLAAGLYDLTGGRVNIMSGRKIARVCRYPLAAAVAPGQELCFADAHMGHQQTDTAILINRFHDVPELLSLCRAAEDGTLAIANLTDLLTHDGRKVPPADVRRDCWLKDLGVAKLCSGPTTVGAKAGHNGEHHNHNDVGVFIVHRGGTFFLTDLGAPIYSARTFSSRRYESIFCNSFGHSVPVIDGRLQPAGRQFAGTMSVEGLGGNGPKTIRIEMARAYDAPSLVRATRVIEVPAGGSEVRLTDTFTFREPPTALEEAFMTCQPAELAADGQSVTIRSEADGSVILRAVETAGRFRVAELVEESKAESRTGEIARRISFVPERLEKDMTLRFAIAL